MNSFDKKRILAHRGCWAEEKGLKKNTENALKKALDYGFGLETDVKNESGVIYVSHDIIKQENKADIYQFEDLLDYYQRKKCDSFLAINIKEDGLGEQLEKLFLKYGIFNYFVFDMSIPELLNIKKNLSNFYVRNSEYENCYYLKSLNPKGIWLDSFDKNYDLVSHTINLMENWSNIAVVSPELHGKDYSIFWDQIFKKIKNNNEQFNLKKFMICTDYPLKFYNLISKINHD